MNTEKVIFFDGLCGLCNGFVDFVMLKDKKQEFKFSPLQSDFAQSVLDPQDVTDLKSVVVRLEGKTYKKSAAVFKVFHELGGGWKILAGLEVLPTPLLNWGYDLVAKNRYKLFGKKETCRLPTPEERQRFIL